MSIGAVSAELFDALQAAQTNDVAALTDALRTLGATDIVSERNGLGARQQLVSPLPQSSAAATLGW